MNYQMDVFSRMARMVHGKRLVKFPEYSMVPAREASFLPRWTWELRPFVKSLAEAGFFFFCLGLNYSTVACFHCGIVVEFPSAEEDRRKWEVFFEDPWLAHCYLNPHCGYVELAKGLPYIFKIFQDCFRTLGLQRKTCVMSETQMASMKCHVCLERELQVAFIPCGHVCCCGVCAPPLDKCPVCRSDFEEKKRIYLC